MSAGPYLPYHMRLRGNYKGHVRAYLYSGKCKILQCSTSALHWRIEELIANSVEKRCDGKIFSLQSKP